VNVEARLIDSVGFTRKCVIAKLRELTIDKYKSLVQSNAAGLLVILPHDTHSMSDEDKEVSETIS